MLQRPHPPSDDALPPWLPSFAPAPALAEWVEKTFLEDAGALFNIDHMHLVGQDIGFLWASMNAIHRGRDILGEARIVSGGQSKWSQQLAHAQLYDWFGRIPKAIITLHAGYARICSDAAFCALVEHELYHFAHAQGLEGPKFTLEGMPVLEMRGHDIEEFVGVVRRYGAVTEEIAAMAGALRDGPTVGKASVAAACGTCLRLVA